MPACWILSKAESVAIREKESVLFSPTPKGPGEHSGVLRDSILKGEEEEREISRRAALRMPTS